MNLLKNILDEVLSNYGLMENLSYLSVYLIS
jgi:hypothetical protein